MLNATVTRRIEITPELVRYSIKPDEGFDPFIPGQYVAVGLPGSSPRPEHFPPEKAHIDPAKLIKRAYSIGSSPSEDNGLEFYIAIVPDGALTSRLALVKEGDRIYLAPKITGTFTITPVPPEKNLVFVSTGTGIAPFISMLRTPSTWTEGRKIQLLHGVRFPKDLGYREELNQFVEKYPNNFSYYPIVSRDDGSPWDGFRGYVQGLITHKKVIVDASVDHVFLCGNPGMIDEVEKMLTTQGFIEHSRKVHGNLHLERYW